MPFVFRIAIIGFITKTVKRKIIFIPRVEEEFIKKSVTFFEQTTN